MQVWNLLEEEEEEGAGAAGVSSAVGTWALLSPPGSPKRGDTGGCSCHASIHSFLRITQDVGSCCLLELHSWCAEPCRTQSDTHICGFGMEKQIPSAEEPIRRLSEPGECWAVCPGKAAESQQSLPGMCPMEMLCFPGCQTLLTRCPWVTWSLAVLQPALPTLVQCWGNGQQTLAGLFLVILKQRTPEHK